MMFEFIELNPYIDCFNVLLGVFKDICLNLASYIVSISIFVLG